MIMMGLDAFSNSLGGYIGCILLMNEAIGEQVNPVVGQCVLGGSFLALAVMEYFLHGESANEKNKCGYQRKAAGVFAILIVGAVVALFRDTNPYANNPLIIEKTIFALSIITLVNNFCLNFSFGMTGAEKAIIYVSAKIDLLGKSVCFFGAGNSKLSFASSNQSTIEHEVYEALLGRSRDNSGLNLNADADSDSDSPLCPA